MTTTPIEYEPAEFAKAHRGLWEWRSVERGSGHTHERLASGFVVYTQNMSKDSPFTDEVINEHHLISWVFAPFGGYFAKVVTYPEFGKIRVFKLGVGAPVQVYEEDI